MKAEDLGAVTAGDLERYGSYLGDLRCHELVRHVGNVIWLNLQVGIRDGMHPSNAVLVAFLRCWADPEGDWLPAGMADYLADRFDKAVPTPGPSGHPSKAISKKHDAFRLEIDIAMDVLRSWAQHKEDGTDYPQKTACKAVAAERGMAVTKVRVIFSQRRQAAEVEARLAEGVRMADLSDEEFRALDHGPQGVWDLIVGSFTPAEEERVATGESIESVLLNPDKESPRPIPWLPALAGDRPKP